MTPAQLAASMMTAVHFLNDPVPTDALPDYLRERNRSDRPQQPAKHRSREVVKALLDRGFTLVFWTPVGDGKGPHVTGWLERAAAGGYTLDDYRDGMQVGIMHGVPLAGYEQKIVCDVDIDYADGQDVALTMLPTTKFIWGRKSKHVSHLLYTVGQQAPLYAFKDVGKHGATLIEFRPDLHQSMAPPSVWRKDGKEERLAFRADGEMLHVDDPADLKRQVTLAAIAMLLAKHLGTHGFGHETRLAWAGFLMRVGVQDDDLQKMGVALSKACHNTEVDDIAKVIRTTRTNLTTDSKKVKGGPARAKIIGEQGKAVVTRIAEWLGQDADFIRDKDGKIVAKSQENIRRALERLNVTLSHDEFADRELIQEGDGTPEHLEDPHIKAVYLRIDDEFKFLPPYDFYTMVVDVAARGNKFHPVREYLHSLTWDNRPRIDTWMLDYCGAEDTPYNRAVSAIMLKAAVKRAFQPGCKYDEMVVWESPQGLGKSTMARELCPNPDWFSDDLPLTSDSKVLIEKTLGKWIIEVSELAGKRKAEQEQLKAMSSRQVDGPARMAYARKPVERPRQFILIGTTNLQDYLADPTGGRRWWPIKVTQMDVSGMKAVREQLWAEAVVRVKAGESIRLPEELWPAATKEQARRQAIDPWEPEVRAALQTMTPSGDGTLRVTADELWMALCVPVERRDRAAQRRLSEIMQERLGFERKIVRDANNVSRQGYVGVLMDADDDIDDDGRAATGMSNDYGF